ncbi:MAG: HAMP domain-containing histidine kinase [Nitrospirae bacterium]|nr:HAMP domain-containing histidine kinase [Nitrospirota bacterium]MCL5238727.1 HAMP domain-containing histidine kinase [Nitrospirota bacterium]
MKAGPEILMILLSASLLLLLLLTLALFLPRYLKKKETPVEHIEMNSVMGAFNALGSEIKSLKEQLIMRERLAALGEVSAGIAHELRNPMGVIAGYAKLLLKSLDAADSRKEIAQGILTEIEGMNRVMEELLKFSKSEPLTRRDIELVKFVGDIIKGMDEPGSIINFQSVNPVSIKGDETLLRQAVRNLLQNAVHAGDKIRISIEKTVLSDKEYICIAVKDNGSGIPDEQLSKVFLPFYTTKSGGSGIGLALAQKIALAHGGSVSVNSKEGKGSTFRLFLPAQ